MKENAILERLLDNRAAPAYKDDDPTDLKLTMLKTVTETQE